MLRLGKIEVDNKGQAALKTPGLHFKIPLINQIWRFTTRLQTLDIQSSRIVTAEKKDVIVDYYVKWRISNPALYYTRTGGNATNAQILLEQQLNDGLRAEFGRRTIAEVIADARGRTCIARAVLARSIPAPAFRRRAVSRSRLLSKTD